CVVPAQSVTVESLAFFEEQGMVSLIITAPRWRQDDAATVAVLESYFAMPRLWLERDAGGFALSRARAYQRAGLLAAAIGQPLLPLAPDDDFDSLNPE